MTYKRIVVASDGSDASIAAVKEAVKLAKAQKAQLRIVHVLDENIITFGEVYLDYNAIWSSFKQEGQKILTQMEKIAQRAKVKCESRLIELKPLEGRIAEKIIAEAKKWSADLLVIGTHGRRGFSRLFMGSVAEGIIRIATTPVLLIRGK